MGVGLLEAGRGACGFARAVEKLPKAIAVVMSSRDIGPAFVSVYITVKSWNLLETKGTPKPGRSHSPSPGSASQNS